MAAGTVTLRTRTQSGATTKGSRLTHEELDDNFLFLQSGTGALVDTVQNVLRRRPISVLGFIPPNLHAGIAAGTDTTDLATYIEAAFTEANARKITDTTDVGGNQLDALVPVYFPTGRYNVDTQVDLPGSFAAIGDNAIIDCEGITGLTTYAWTGGQYYGYIDGLIFLGGSNAVFFDGGAQHEIYISRSQFRAQTNFGIKNNVGNARVTLREVEFHGAAKQFASLYADSMSLNKINVFAQPTASANNTGCFEIGGRMVAISDSLLTPSGAQTSTQRAWFDVNNLIHNLHFKNVSFGGEVGRRTAVNLNAEVKLLKFSGCDFNASADTNGQISGVPIAAVRLFGDYLRRLVISGESGIAGSQTIIDFATAAATTMTNFEGMTLLGCDLASTPARFPYMKYDSRQLIVNGERNQVAVIVKAAEAAGLADIIRVVPENATLGVNIQVLDDGITDYEPLRLSAEHFDFEARTAALTVTRIARLSSSGLLFETTNAGIGYTTGAGGTVTQGAGSGKATGVTLNRMTGEITLDSAALAADTTVSFTLINSSIGAGDHVVVQHVSVGTQGAYNCTALAAAGSATINVRNVTPGSLSEAIIVKFTIIKAVTA